MMVELLNRVSVQQIKWFVSVQLIMHWSVWKIIKDNKGMLKFGIRDEPCYRKRRALWQSTSRPADPPLPTNARKLHSWGEARRRGTSNPRKWRYKRGSNGAMNTNYKTRVGCAHVLFSEVQQHRIVRRVKKLSLLKSSLPSAEIEAQKSITELVKTANPVVPSTTIWPWRCSMIVSAPARASSLRKGINTKTVKETANSEPQESHKTCRTNGMVLGELFNLIWRNQLLLSR